MSKLIYGLFLVLISTLSYGQSFEFKYFNQETNKFELEDWKFHQIIRWVEERDLLIIEVIDKSNVIISLQNDIELLKRDTANLVKEIGILKEDLIIEIKEKQYYKDLYNESLKINVSGDKTISSVEWALKKEKLRNKWLTASTIVTTGAILTYVIIELTKK